MTNHRYFWLYIFILLLPLGVGKSSIVLRFVTDTFTEEYLSTIEDSYRKTCFYDGKTIYLEILDTAGQEEFSSARDGWVREGNAFILVYSVTSTSSFLEIEEHHRNIMLVHDNEKVPIVLVGNKTDLAHERQVSTEDGRKLAKHYGIPFVETSALEGTNCDFAFQEAIRLIFEKEEDQKRKNAVQAPPPRKWKCEIL